MRRLPRRVTSCGRLEARIARAEDGTKRYGASLDLPETPRQGLLDPKPP